MRKKNQKHCLSQRPQGKQRKAGIHVSCILRLTDPAHISCPFGARSNFTRRVCGFAGMNHSLNSGKNKFQLCDLCVLERPYGSGREGKIF
ncbi:MAG: hypothetical protein NT010_08970 [Proteobacteria bacterium]|nr:hypothetical protein [Pseudomonadota bacterium]